MENKNERYTFGGFSFGSENWFNLTIRTRNHAGHGTSHGLELALELSTEERLELIKVLTTRNSQEDN